MNGRVWVTGAHGFIGRHLARHLHRAGGRVHGLGHGHWTENERAQWGIEGWINGDVEYANLQQLAEQFGKPQVVFHLAGGASVGQSIGQPLEDFRRTVDSTAGVLEWLRHHAPDARLVYVSSAAVYGDGHKKPIPECSPLRPSSPYGHHKAMAEELCTSYAECYSLRVTIVRFFSLFGPGLTKQLIWDACTRLRDGKSLEFGGTGSECRDWLYIEDAVRLLTGAWQAVDEAFAVINGGSGRAIQVAEAVRAVLRAWGSAAEPRFSGQVRPGDPEYLVADVRNLRSLGFVPSVDFEDGVMRTVRWFKERYGHE